jgi:regulator of replication initiation timing
MRGIGRRIRSNFGIGSSRMAIRSQLAWYWRWMLNLLMMAAVGGVVWWIVENSYHITGSSMDEVKQRLATLTEENATLKREVETARATLVDRDRQLQIEKAAQGELTRTVGQLQDENATLKEDLGFLRKLMSSGTTPEGIGLSELRVERDGASKNAYRYRLLLTQGGQRKQDFKGRLQVVAHVLRGSEQSALTFPDANAAPAAGALDFRFYQKVEGRFALPEGAVLRSVEVRVLALPGGQVKLSRAVNFP